MTSPRASADTDVEMNSVKASLVAGIMLCASSCDSSPAKPDAPAASQADKAGAAAAPEATSGSQEKAEPIAVATARPGAPGREPGDVAPEAMEKDPNATELVTLVDHKGELPPDATTYGVFRDAIGWTDKYGKHAIVFGLSESEKGDETTTVLVADFISWEGDAWTSQRKFKERVDKCQFDTALYEMVGDWSVTDLDKNGIAEVTFAWRVGCRSDVSPVGHKVLIVGYDESVEVAKYVLRGDTAIKIGGGVEGGGKYRGDSAFKKAPPSYLEHAKMVWSKTSVETY